MNRILLIIAFIPFISLRADITGPSSKIVGPNGAKVDVSDGNASITPQSGGAVNIVSGDTYVPTRIDFSTTVSPTLTAPGHAAIAYDGTNLLLSKNGGAYAILGGMSSAEIDTLAELNAIVGDDDVAGLAASNTFSGANINSKSGAASVSAMKYTGVPFAGTGTTSFPLLYVNDANAAASTTLNTAGTYFGINGDGTQDLMNLLKDGTSQFKVSSVGTATTVNLDAGSGGINTRSGSFGWFGASSFILTGSTAITMSTGDTSGFQITRDLVNGISLKSGANTVTWNDPSTATSGTVANRYLFGIAAPTLTATNSSVTDTVASTVYIGGAPTASTNTTIGTAYSLFVDAGVSRFDGGVLLNGVTVSGLPASPAAGTMAYVTDGSGTPAWGDTVTGGGSTKILVWYNGTNWTAIGK